MATKTNHNNPYARDDYPPHITLEWLVHNRLPVYVRNTTRPCGQLAINFPRPGGGVKAEKIPRTHLPIELSARVSPDTITSSDDFRSCITKGVVEVVRPDRAWEELQDPDNIAETDRLQLSAFSAKNAFVSKRVQDMSETVENRVDPEKSVQSLGVDTSVINPRIMRFVEQLKNGDISIKSAIGELKTMRRELTDRDCSYIISNGPAGQIKTYVQKVLADIQGTGLAAYSVEDDGAPEMTSEEREAERQREAMAREQQQV